MPPAVLQLEITRAKKGKLYAVVEAVTKFTAVTPSALGSCGLALREDAWPANFILR